MKTKSVTKTKATTKAKATKAKSPTVAKMAKRDFEIADAYARMVDLAETIGVVEVAYREAPEGCDGALCNCADHLTNDFIQAAYNWAILSRK